MEAALAEVERLQKDKKHDRDKFTARASTTGAEGHTMRNGEGGIVPSYNAGWDSLIGGETVAGAVAVNIALGGSDTNMTPAVDFFKELHQNQPIVPKQTSYARVVSGEIPILFDYDFNAYRAKYGESGHFEFVIPCEGTVVFPYVTSLVKNAPDKEKAQKVLDYFLSDKGQAMWANAYLRPSRPIELPAAIKAKFLPDSEYARAKSVD